MTRSRFLPLWIFLLAMYAATLRSPAQHDPGRDAVRLLAKGAVDDALARVAKARAAPWLLIVSA